MLVSGKELKNLKLGGIRSHELKEFVSSVGIDIKGNAGEIIKKCVNTNISQVKLDSFIKAKYKSQVLERQKIISDKELIEELKKVSNFSWGVVQGQLDQKIQSEYVRKFFRYKDLLNNITSKLHDEITSYVIATWYNHWTTVLIEDHISFHPKVIPTLKNNFGVDIFFGDQPFDLKTTYLPKDYSVKDAIENPKKLAVWMYENQGAQRFGSDNRFFVILVDKNNPDQSWKLKRDFDFVYKKIDGFFDTATVSSKDEVIFTFKKKTYTAISKVLIITK